MLYAIKRDRKRDCHEQTHERCIININSNSANVAIFFQQNTVLYRNVRREKGSGDPRDSFLSIQFIIFFGEKKMEGGEEGRNIERNGRLNSVITDIIVGRDWLWPRRLARTRGTFVWIIANISWDT